MGRRATLRCVTPEALDELGADDPQALQSRRDLKRIHTAMRSVAALRRTVRTLHLATQPRRIIELGAGDGTLLLRFAGAIRPQWRGVELTLLDRLDLVSRQTHEAYRRLDWRVTVVRRDALEWSLEPGDERFDLCIANLFVHHFDEGPLHNLLKNIAAGSNAFVACEPRRSAFSRIASRLVALLGANRITREDAVKSVGAGFTGLELSRAWAAHCNGWRLNEFMELPFTHCFSAARQGADACGGVRAI